MLDNSPSFVLTLYLILDLQQKKFVNINSSISELMNTFLELKLRHEELVDYTTLGILGNWCLLPFNNGQNISINIMYKST